MTTRIQQKQHWVRFANRAGQIGFGTLADDGLIRVHTGNMFDGCEATGKSLAQADVQLLMPTAPSKVIVLWNNFAALGAKLNLGVPPEPLYLLKAPNSFANPGDMIRQPASKGKVAYEGELGIVIGKTATGASEADAMDCVFGYTCGNDMTEADILNRDPSFTQWVRAKGFDTFCPLGARSSRPDWTRARWS